MIGLVDWGIGGLGIARSFTRPFLYLSDTGSPPYGELDRRALAARLRKAVSLLRDRGAKKIVLACNAASTALPDLEDIANVSGVILPTIDHVVKLRPKSIVVVGGRRTILSRVYATAFRSRGIAVTQKIAQPLSGMIERGEQSSQKFEREVARILRDTSRCDALVLAGTHYPAAMPVFEKIFAGRVVDPAAAVLRSIGMREKSAAETQIFTTGDPHAMKHAATRAWGIRIEPKKIGV
ncbi:MAG: glutamate racemase [Polyangiaceae bacterium]